MVRCCVLGMAQASFAVVRWEATDNWFPHNMNSRRSNLKSARKKRKEKSLPVASVEKNHNLSTYSCCGTNADNGARPAIDKAPRNTIPVCQSTDSQIR